MTGQAGRGAALHGSNGEVDGRAASAWRFPTDNADIRVWCWDLDAEADAARDHQVLSPAELERAGRFRVLDAARRFVTCRAALRRVLGDLTGQPPRALRLRAEPLGKPVMDGGPCFNLSHSRGWAMLAVAAFPVGIDIEAVRPTHPQVEHLVFTAAERRDLDRVPAAERSAAFFRAWTRKEAAIKAVGGSIADAPSFTVTLGIAPGIRAAGHGGPWQLADLPAPAGFAATLAARRTGWKVLWPDGAAIS